MSDFKKTSSTEDQTARFLVGDIVKVLCNGEVGEIIGTLPRRAELDGVLYRVQLQFQPPEGALAYAADRLVLVEKAKE